MNEDKEEVINFNVDGDLELQKLSSSNISFHGDENDMVGTLTWEGGKFHFEGDADASAQIFFDSVVSLTIEAMKKDG